MKLKEMVLAAALALPMGIEGHPVFNSSINLSKIEEGLGLRIESKSRIGGRKVDLVVGYRTCLINGDTKIDSQPWGIFDLRDKIYFIDYKLNGDYQKGILTSWRDHIPKSLNEIRSCKT